jgi:hypothetical protein
MTIMHFKPLLVLRVIWNAEFSTDKELKRSVNLQLSALQRHGPGRPQQSFFERDSRQLLIR